MAKLTLNKCKKGDLLISKHGKAFIYSHKDKSRRYPHIIHDIISAVECSRLDNGNVFSKKRYPEDHDIVKIIPQSQSALNDKWISVKDRLPEIGKSVLVYPSIQIVSFGEDNPEFMQNDITDTDFSVFDTYWDKSMPLKIKPTHRMPLPNNPI